MGKSTPSAPAAPDPVATAQAQASGNIDTARTTAELNRVNQYTPYGNLTYSQVPGQPDSWNATTTLSPAEQQNLNYTNQGQNIYGQAAVNQLQSAAGTLSTPFTSNAPDLTAGATQGALQSYQGALNANAQPVNTDYNAVRQQAIDAANSRLQPQQQMQEEDLRSRLLNSGITEGSEAWNNAYRQYNNSVNDAQQQTILNAENLTGQSISQTGQLRQIPIGEAGQIGSIAGNIGNLGNTQMQQSLGLYNQPLNTASALLTGSQIQQPNFTNVPQTNVSPTDYIGAQGQALGQQNVGYNAQLQAANANKTGMYGLGATALTAGAIAI